MIAIKINNKTKKEEKNQIFRRLISGVSDLRLRARASIRAGLSSQCLPTIFF